MRNIIKPHKLARSIYDASWLSLSIKIAYRSERDGKLFVKAYTKNMGQICTAR